MNGSKIIPAYGGKAWSGTSIEKPPSLTIFIESWNSSNIDVSKVITNFMANPAAIALQS